METTADKSNSTKARILSEGLRLFAEKGYEATTMKDIGSAVGIKAASLYSHFAGKAELYRAVFESALEAWQGLVQGIFARAENCEDPREGLNLIMGDFACGMMGSVAYRFWAQVYVFPPRILGPADIGRLIAMDRGFAERIGLFCVPRLPSSTPREDLAMLGTFLSYFVMGILNYAEFMDEASLRGEIHRGIEFHLRAIRA